MPKKLLNSLLKSASQSISIWKFPTVIDNPWRLLHSPTKGRRRQMTLGDQHGNFLKLLYSLIEKGVVQCEKDTYKALVELENAHLQLMKEMSKVISPSADQKKRLKIQIAHFRELIATLAVTEEPGKEMLVRLIGDVLADRGSNDFFTLLIIDELKKKGLNFEILASNHDDAFFRPIAMEGMKRKNPQQVRSATHMQALIKHGIVEQKEVNQLKKSYFQSIKLFSYSIESDENGKPSKLNIFNHAVAGPACLQSLIKTYQNTVFKDVQYRASTWEEICETIDAINEKFMAYCVSKNINEPWKAYEALMRKEDAVADYKFPHVRTPFIYLTWNRTKRPDDDIWGKKGGVEISTIHGHIGNQSVYHDNEGINLDDNAGKWAQFQDKALSAPPVLVEGKNPIYVASCYTSLKVWREEYRKYSSSSLLEKQPQCNQEYQELKALLNKFMNELKNCLTLLALSSRDVQDPHYRFWEHENERLVHIIKSITPILQELPLTIDENTYSNVQSKVKEIQQKLAEIDDITSSIEKIREVDAEINRESTNESFAPPAVEKKSQQFISLKSLRVNLSSMLSQLKSWIGNLTFLWKQDTAQQQFHPEKKDSLDITIQQKAEKFLRSDMAKLWGKKGNSNTETNQEDNQPNQPRIIEQ